MKLFGQVDLRNVARTCRKKFGKPLCGRRKQKVTLWAAGRSRGSIVNCCCSRSFLKKTNLQDSFTSVFLRSVAPGLSSFWQHVFASVVTGRKVGDPEGSASLLTWAGFLCRLEELDRTRESRKSAEFFSQTFSSPCFVSSSFVFLPISFSEIAHYVFFSQLHSNGVADTLKWIATPIQRNMRDKGVRFDWRMKWHVVWLPVQRQLWLKWNTGKA